MDSGCQAVTVWGVFSTRQRTSFERERVCWADKLPLWVLVGVSGLGNLPWEYFQKQSLSFTCLSHPAGKLVPGTQQLLVVNDMEPGVTYLMLQAEASFRTRLVHVSSATVPALYGRY